MERNPCSKLLICAKNLEENRQEFPHLWQHLFCRHPIRKSLVMFLQDGRLKLFDAVLKTQLEFVPLDKLSMCIGSHLLRILALNC